MPSRVAVVTRPRLVRPELPADLSPGAAVLLRLAGKGVIAEVAERLQIDRQGGYSGLHLFAVAVLHLLTSPTTGLQSFCDALAPHAKTIAGLVGQTRLPTASSSSRLLCAVPADLAHAFGRWLLESALDVSPLLRCGAVFNRDAHGRDWHVFDYDPTVDTLQRRPLRSSDDAPPSRRRSDAMAKPGYTGRKRGEVRFRRSAMQHAGAGIWVHAQLDDGKGDLRDAFTAAVDAAKATVAKAGGNGRILVRMDGEFHGVPYLDICQQAGVSYVTRLTRPTILERESVRQRLREASWFLVRNSSGLQRYAADLGWCRLDPADETVRADGTAYDPVYARIVVTRIACGEKAGRGVKVGDEQVEMFATNLDAGAWPPAALVECYLQRSSLENRFAQEDRLLGLDRIFSYHLPGQELMTAIGLFLWNLQIIEGFALQPVPASAIAPARSVPADIATPLPPLFPPPPDSAPQALAAAALAAPPTSGPTEEDLIEAIETQLDTANWDRLPPQWSRLRGSLALQCPAGKTVPLSHFQLGTVVEGATRAAENRASFKTGARFCIECPLWRLCHQYERHTPEKAIGKALPPEAARTAEVHWREVLRLRRERRTPGRLERPSARRHADPPPSARFRPAPWHVDDDRSAPGVSRPTPPTFLPREAQKHFMVALGNVRLEIRLKLAPAPSRPTPHPLVRAHGTTAMPSRQTWAHRRGRYALRPGTRVTTFVYGDATGQAAVLGASRSRATISSILTA